MSIKILTLMNGKEKFLEKYGTKLMEAKFIPNYRKMYSGMDIKPEIIGNVATVHLRTESPLAVNLTNEEVAYAYLLQAVDSHQIETLVSVRITEAVERAYSEIKDFISTPMFVSQLITKVELDAGKDKDKILQWRDREVLSGVFKPLQQEIDSQLKTYKYLS